MGGNIQGSVIIPPADSLGYIKYNSADSLAIDNALFTEADLFEIEGGFTGGVSPSAGGGCNISFEHFLAIDFNLPDFSFDFLGSDFDTSLFDKADAISLEFTMMNEMLINTILDMNCCDIAKVYNGTMVPFFQFFADSNGGGFIKMITRYAEVITALRALVEPLECLIRWVPGNPWFPKDFDYLAWIYGYFKESKPFLDRILSGELLDIVLNPVHNMRVKMQACLTTGIPEGQTFEGFLEVGSPDRLMAISALAAKDGSIVSTATLPPVIKPTKPITSDYRDGASNGSYINDLADYEKLIVIYNNQIRYRNEAKAEIERQSVAHQTLNRNMAVTGQTNLVIHAHTDGLCGCIADALNLNNISIELFPVRTTGDLYKLEGKTIAGVTCKTAGCTSKNRPKDSKYTVEKRDIEKNTAQAAICSSGSSKGGVTKCVTEVKTVEKKSNYPSIDPTKNSAIACQVKVITQAACLAKDQLSIMKQNDKNQDTLNEVIKESQALSADIEHNRIVYKDKWDTTRAALLLKLTNATHAQQATQINSDRISTLTSQKSLIELDVAQSIYDGYYGVFNSVNLSVDPTDSRAITNFLLDDEFWGMFPADYWSASSELSSLRIAELSPDIQQAIKSVPFPPNTPPQNIIATLPISTDVDCDERFLVNYFNGGFVKEKGTSNWRNFNKLNILWNEFSQEEGAIAPDKTDEYYMAIFPTDTIGDLANLKHVREHYVPRSELRDFLKSELDINDTINVDGLVELLTTKYGFDSTEYLMNFSDEDISIIINELSVYNGYESGKLWVKTRVADANLKFEADYEYTAEGTNAFTITANGQTISNDYLISNDGGNVAVTAKESVNASIKDRAGYYEKVINLETQNQYLHVSVDSIRSSLVNSIASMVPTEIPLLIPCTCDNFLCMLLNLIIQYVMGALNRLIQELITMIIQFLIPDWIKDILRTIQDFLKCLGSVFGIFYTIGQIHEYTEDLLESMKDRIRYYPADACFIPTDPFPELPSEMPGDSYDGDDTGEGDDDGGDNNDGGDNDDGGTYLPPGGTEDPGFGGGGDDGGGPTDPRRRSDCKNPPVILTDAVKMVPGLPGRCIPGLKFQCEYLEI